MPNPEFRITFNVDEDDYISFIEDLRIRTADPDPGPSTSSHAHGIPVLRPQENPPTRFFDVVLKTGDRSVTFRIQSDNLYLIGYQVGAGQWHEFSNGEKKKLIDGSEFLPYNGSYVSLEGGANKRRPNIPLGQQQLITAVSDIARSTRPDEAVARALIVIIQMISESMRFRTISDAIDENYYSGFLPPDHIQALENGWGDLSNAVLRHNNNPQDDSIQLPADNRMGITTLHAAILALGILLIRGSKPRDPRPRRDVDMETTAGQALIFDGRPLVEVFYVRILNIDGEDPGQLYGTVTATDGLQSYYIYNRDRGDYESISPGEHATLTGPSRAISAAGDFIIDFNLMDSDSLSPDDEISRGQIAWNVYDYTNVYDKLQTDTISGKYGSAALNYVVMSNAAEALVEVILINGDGEDPANVYGRIYSQNSSFDGQIELFRRSAKDYVDVHPKNPIPLLRSALAVPMDASLKISAYLWDRDDISSDDEIAKGTAEFKPEILKSASKFIDGHYGRVEVRVTWN